MKLKPSSIALMIAAASLGGCAKKHNSLESRLGRSDLSRLTYDSFCTPGEKPLASLHFDLPTGRQQTQWVHIPQQEGVATPDNVGPRARLVSEETRQELAHFGAPTCVTNEAIVSLTISEGTVTMSLPQDTSRTGVSFRHTGWKTLFNG